MTCYFGKYSVHFITELFRLDGQMKCSSLRIQSEEHLITGKISHNVNEVEIAEGDITLKVNVNVM